MGEVEGVPGGWISERCWVLPLLGKREGEYGFEVMVKVSLNGCPKP